MGLICIYTLQLWDDIIHSYKLPYSGSMSHAICLMSIPVHIDKNSNPFDHCQAGVSINRISAFSTTRKLQLQGWNP